MTMAPDTSKAIAWNSVLDGAALGPEDFTDHFWALGCDSQQGLGSTRWLAPTLLPLLKGAGRDSENLGEL